MIGVLYVAFGKKAHLEARLSIETLRRFHDWPVTVIGDKPIPGTKFEEFENVGTSGRWAKVNLNNLSYFTHTLYLDADTRVYAPLDVGFKALEAGWDLVMVPSKPQDFGHCSDEERAVIDCESAMMQLNTGVMWFRNNDRIKEMFAEWRRQWWRFCDKDQGALVRALEVCPVKIWLLGWPFNGGALVGHRFGACR